MIDADIKHQEYRDIKPHWERIFKAGYIKIKGVWYPAHKVKIVFINGYASDAPRTERQCMGLKISKAKAEWSGNAQGVYFTLCLKPKNIKKKIVRKRGIPLKNAVSSLFY